MAWHLKSAVLLKKFQLIVNLQIKNPNKTIPNIHKNDLIEDHRYMQTTRHQNFKAPFILT